MSECGHCGVAAEYPHRCAYCEGVYCGDHRLPEAHDCDSINVVRERERPIEPPEPITPGTVGTAKATYEKPPPVRLKSETEPEPGVVGSVVAWVRKRLA